jgi:hypothetical protein
MRSSLPNPALGKIVMERLSRIPKAVFAALVFEYSFKN